MLIFSYLHLLRRYSASATAVFCICYGGILHLLRRYFASATAVFCICYGGILHLLRRYLFGSLTAPNRLLCCAMGLASQNKQGARTTAPKPFG